jgi:hypothetical protein
MENILTQPVGKSIFYYNYKYEGYDYYYCELMRSFSHLGKIPTDDGQFYHVRIQISI